MSKSNPYLIQIASRLAERAELFHQASLRHLEASRVLYSQGLRGEHDASVAAGYAREAIRQDSELRKLIREFPDIEVVPSNYLELLPENKNTTQTTLSSTHSGNEYELNHLTKMLENLEPVSY